MTKQSLAHRIEEALKASSLEESLLALAKQMKQEGVSQAETHELFEAQWLRHRDSNEAVSDDIGYVLDRIVGWCGPEWRLFDTELKK